MDPHSRHSQFNKRQRKVGPVPPNTRYMEQVKAAPATDNVKKRAGSFPSPALSTIRPIASNSRVRQDEKYRKDMYLAFINNALQQKANGNSEALDELLDQFNLKKPTSGDAPSPTPQLRLWILALSHVVSRLDRSLAPLVEAIVNLPWTTMDTAFVKSYTIFIGMLVSARPEYLSLVLGTITRGFTHQSGIQALDSILPEGSSRPLTRRVIYERQHYLLRHLLSLIPTLPSTLQPLLLSNFPHKRQSQVAHITYIRNLLQVMDYCPEFADRILATIVDRALQIDVEIQVELEELEDLQEANGQEEVFEIDPFDTVVGQEGSDGESDVEDEDDIDDFSDLSSDADGEVDEVAEPEVPADLRHVQDMVNKLDAILKLIFDHFNRSNATTPSAPIRLQTPLIWSRPNSPLLSSDPPSEPLRPPSLETIERGKARRRSQFHALLSIFDRSIIRTFKSRYTQFLVFWYSSLDPEFSDLFQGMLVSKALLEDDQPVVTRAAAASYIASFVSRAQFVDRESTRRVVSVLCNFLKSHLDIMDAVVAQAGAILSPAQSMGTHSVFYAICQAVFLVFCFRWRDLVEEQEVDVDELSPISASTPGKKWMPELSIVQRVITSPLNPLKVCSANVVAQFARIAQATDFIYCYTIMESNRRTETDYTSSAGKLVSDSRGAHSRVTAVHPAILGHSINAELNTFFPFDPYKLPKSASYIEGVYREWASVAIGDEDEDEEEDDASNGGDGLQVPQMSQSDATDDDADGLGVSFGSMSISPVRPPPLVTDVV
ncbi:RNA polymerase I-specific transcription initiation factor RRN3 [Neolentinus lepideus HHB14362 ss-1]|uniref:RNA polymerase I-specific transcription initiation factor RRN3 n=1 Tax=Neolentinus lepideus HHB14362 ss-1 TaxID=1314782 RepID=A0A165S2F9_9AGAM|nr:RNA polymerase I-specific transcription initiation factor RRN3 [Neolentinus lepideus HHB14362 ss-1]